MGLARLKEFELTNEYLVPGKTETTPSIKKIDRRFLKGPIPWSWLCEASKLSEKALHVAIGLWFIAGMTKNRTVKMQKRVLDGLGISRHAFYRARDKMEEAGLIAVVGKTGQTHSITLL
jgi:hypothetical protein